jgi:penicillin-insensitive murein DD-endopeptidase
MLKRLTLSSLLLLAALVPASAEEGNPWSRAAAPTVGAPQAIGGPARGCLEGAVTLPPAGPGYEVTHLSRHRYFGLPETVDFVRHLGAESKAAGLPPILVGDMAQPRGGPTSYGHAAHQNGVDVDIWFTLAPRTPLTVAAREDIDLPSMLLPNWRAVDTKRFGAAQIELLRFAATSPRVDRIFVNPVIKATLCRKLPVADHAWLGKLRPWFGHDDHFHVRLTCPADSPECQGQAPVPPGDGCDAVLASWVRDQRPPPPESANAPPPHHAMPKLPAMCRAVLAMPAAATKTTSLP